MLIGWHAEKYIYYSQLDAIIYAEPCTGFGHRYIMDQDKSN